MLRAALEAGLRATELRRTRVVPTDRDLDVGRWSNGVGALLQEGSIRID